MKHRVICIGRQFGSGGHEVGLKLSGRLGVSFYDRNLIDLAAEQGGIRMSRLKPVDEHLSNPWLYESLHETSQRSGRGLPPSDALFQLQSRIICEAARREDCVIVGRCGGWVLRQAGISCLSLFLCAPFDSRVARKMEQEQLPEKQAANLVRRQDKHRKAYYDFYTGDSWGKPEHYDLCLNTAHLGIDGTEEFLSRFLLQTD